MRASRKSRSRSESNSRISLVIQGGWWERVLIFFTGQSLLAQFRMN